MHFHAQTRRSFLALFAGLLLLGLSPSFAKNRTPNAEHHSASSFAGRSHRAPDAVDFDYYLFAMSIAPGFCAQNAERASRKIQCEPKQLKQDFALSPITIHGLWPNRTSGRHPFFCERSGERKTQNQHHCSLAAVQNIDLPTRIALKTAMPGSKDCLDRWQWAKHGSCSGLSEDDYFDIQIDWLSRVKKLLAADIAQSAGKNLDIGRWRAKAQHIDPEVAQNLQFVCKSPSKYKGERTSDRTQPPATLLVEIKLALEKDARRVRPLSDPRRGISGCRNGQAFIAQP